RLERSTQPSARLRRRLERSTQPSARLRRRLERSTQPSARLRRRLELPRGNREGVRDVADGLDAALVVDHHCHHVEAAGLLAQTLGPEIALGQLADLVLLPGVDAGLGRRGVLELSPGLD